MINRYALLRRSALLASSALLPLWAAPALAQNAPVLPNGGTVVAGSATLGAPAGDRLAIQQSSDRAIIEWNGFSIGSGGTVHIENGSGATLNRVTGSSVSSINGLLSATGSVYLLNPNGVIIGKDGVVNVGGSFVASTLGLSNAGFMAGGDQSLSGASRAEVVNLGRIGALGGDVVLAGFTVVNKGTITSPGGTTGLVAGQAVLLSDRTLDAGRFQVVLGGAGSSATNSGTIAAAAAELRANGGSIYALAGNTTGVIRADGVTNSDGRIFLTAGTGGTITLENSALTARTANGGGGTIMVGSADTGRTVVGSGVVLDAAATRGAGGFIETSAEKITLAPDLKVTTLGAGGLTGTWLIDPTDFVVAASGGDITGALVSTLLANTNLEIQSMTGTGGVNGDVIIRDAITWSSNNTLTLNAVRDVLVQSAITATGANAGLVVNYGTGRNFTVSAPITLAGANASLNINGRSYTLLRNVTDLQAIQANLGGYYALAGDIDATVTAGWNGGSGFAPLGGLESDFIGTLDGLGHVVTKLMINRPNDTFIGLFARIGTGGAVRNLGLIGGAVVGTNITGGLAGYIGETTINNVYNTGTVKGNQFVGGLVGSSLSLSAVISDVYATGAVTGTSYVGGLIGRNNAKIDNAYATGAVNGNSYVGGLIGSHANSTITNAYATGPIQASGPTRGGLVAWVQSGTVINSYWDSFSTGQTQAVNKVEPGGTVTAFEITSDPTKANDANYAFKALAYTNLNNAIWYKADGLRPMLRSEYSTTIANAHQLQLMAMDLGANYTLSRNVDATATANGRDVWGPLGFVPVGDATNGFSGSLDGGGHVISGLTINRPDQDNVGLFGRLNAGGAVRNLGQINGAITGKDNAGGLIANNYGTVIDSYATGTVTGNSYVGGLVGNNYGTISTSYAASTVRGDFSGGLVGYHLTGTISKSYATGSVIGSVYVGGLVGVSGRMVGVNETVIDNSYATALASGSLPVGGLVGLINSGTISNSYAAGAASGTIVGGLVGQRDGGTITNSYWDIGTSGQQYSNGGIGLTTAQMHDTSNFVGWDFANIWARADATYRPELFGVSGVVGISVGGSLSRSYGDANPAMPAGPITVVGAGRWNTVTGTFANPTTTANLTSNVGQYAITVSGGTVTRAQGGAARITYLDTVTVTPRTLNVTANAASRLYGVGLRQYSYTSTGLVNGDTLSGQLRTDANPDSDVGTYAITRGTLAAGSNYALNFTEGTLTVNPRPVTVTAQGGNSTYGNTATNPGLSATGLATFDTIAALTGLSNSFGITGTTNAGTYALSVTGTLTNGNYTVTSTSNGSWTVAQRGLNVTANSFSRIYGNANPAFTYTAPGLVNGDTLSGAVASNATVQSNVGAYAIGQGTLSASSNYALNFTSGTLTITPRAVSVFAGNQSLAYGDPILGFGLGVTGLVNGDTLSGALSTDASARPNVGSYAINQGTLDAGSNYAMNFTGATLTITPRALNVTANSLSRSYGDANPLLTYTAPGLVNGDTLSGALASGATAQSGIGGYAISQGTLAAGSNYTLSFTGGTLTVTPRALSVSANNLSRSYGDANPAFGYTTDGLINGDSLTGALSSSATVQSSIGGYAIGQGTLDAGRNYALSFTGGMLTITPRALNVTANSFSRIYGDGNPLLTYTSDNLVNGDTLNGALANNATAQSNIGDYAIGQGTLDAGSNYALNFTNGTLTVTPRPLLVAAGNQSSVYGDPLQPFSYGVNGLVNGDRLSGAVASSATARPNVGSYAIDQGTLDAGSNYVMDFTGGMLTITPRSVSVSAPGGSSIYGNTVANPGLSASNLASFDSIDALTGLGSDFAVTNRSNVGAYTITVTGTLSNANYVIDGRTNGTWTVTPRTITITADRLRKRADMVDPALTWQVGGLGLANGDTLSGALARDAGDTAGDYAIRQGDLAASANYAVTFTPGTLSIAPTRFETRMPIERNISTLLPTLPIAAPTTAECDSETCLLPYPTNRTPGSAIRFGAAQ